MQNQTDCPNIQKYQQRNKNLTCDEQIFQNLLLKQLSTNITPKIFHQQSQNQQSNDKSFSEVLNSYRSTNKKFTLEKPQSQNRFKVFQSQNDQSMQRLQDYEVMINDLMGKQSKEQTKGLNKMNIFSAKYQNKIQPLKQTLQDYLNDEEIKVPKSFLIKNNFQHKDKDLNLKIQKAQREAVLFNGKFQKIYEKENKKIKKQKIIRNSQYTDYIFEPLEKFNDQKNMQINKKNNKLLCNINDIQQNDEIAEQLKHFNKDHIQNVFRISNICIQPITIDDQNDDYIDNALKIINANEEYINDFNEKFPKESMELKQKLFLFYVKQGKLNKIDKILKLAKFEDNLSFYQSIRDTVLNLYNREIILHCIGHVEEEIIKLQKFFQIMIFITKYKIQLFIQILVRRDSVQLGIKIEKTYIGIGNFQILKIKQQFKIKHKQNQRRLNSKIMIDNVTVEESTV